MAQVKKYYEGGKTSTNPDLIKVYGFEYEKGQFFNTLNNNANIDSYVYNSNMNEEQASTFKDALSQYNKGQLTKDHPGVSYVDDYIKELMISPALNVYKKKPKQKITEGELFYKGFINKYYGGNKQLYRDDWYERGDETSRANRIADYLSSMNTEDIYNTFDFSESEFKDATSLKTALDELAKDLRDGITDSDYDKANALGLNLKRWLQKPQELTTEEEKKEEKTASTKEEQLEKLRKQWRQEAIDSNLTADQVEEYIQLKENAYNRTRDIMKQDATNQLETEKIYQFLTNYYDAHESFGKNGQSRYTTEQSDVSNYLFLNGGTVSDLLAKANNIVNQAKTGSRIGLTALSGGNAIVFPNSTLKQIVEEGYPKVKRKLLEIYKGSTTKLTASDIALLKIANTSNYIPVSGYKNNFLNVICFNLSTMTFVRVPLFSHHLQDIIDSPNYPSNSDEKIVLNRVLKAFNNYVSTNYPDINLDHLKKSLRDYEKYRSQYAKTPGNNPWGTNAQDFINKDFLERTRSTTQDETQQVESQKHGGVLSYQAGGIVDALNNKIEAKKAQERKENEILKEKTGLTKEQYKYRYEDVVKFGFGTDGFRSEDWWRLGALAGDLIGLAASFIPGYGTVAAAGLGVGSVIADSVADFKDPSVSAGDAWLNIFKNFGISLVGLLPGGRTGSVTAKLVRNFPRVIGVLNAADAGPDIIKSYIKLVNGEDMTRQDWSNIWDGGRILLAGSREAKAFKTGKKYLTENTENSLVTVKTTNNRTIQLTGKEATEYRKLRTIDEKNAFLKNLNGDRKLAADESIKMTHWNSKVPSASAQPAERVTRGEYRFMTPAEVSEKYNGFIPRSYSRFYKSMKFYQNIGSSSLEKYASNSDGSLPDKTGNIFNRAYSYDHFAEKFNLASNVAGKNAAKRTAKQIKSKKQAEGITPEQTVENTTQPSADAAVTTPSTSSPAPAATGAVVAPAAPEVARSPQKSKPVIIDNRKFKQNDKGNWLELINGRWKRNDPPSNSQIQFDFKIGGKLQKYILKAAGGTAINGPWIWGLDENSYWFSGENNPKNSKYDFNKAKEFYNNYFLSNAYTGDVNKVYDDWKKLNTNGTLDDFTKYYNDHIDTLRAFMKGRKNVQWNSQNDNIGNFNTYFHELFPSYGGGVDYNPALVNTAAGRTQARIAPSFSNNDGSLDYRKGAIKENDSDVKYYLDDEGKIHFLPAGQDYPTSLTSGTSNNSNLYDPSGPWGTDYSAWSSNPDNLSSWINEILNGTRDSEGNVIKKGILGNLPDLNNNQSYDLSVPMEMAKLLNTFITNKTVTDKAMDISVPLDNYYHENSIQNDIYGSTKYYEEQATSLLQNAYKLASTAASPEQAQAIMLNAYREASKLRQQAGLVAEQLIEKNLKSAVDTANDNLKNDIAVANENNRKIAAVNEAKKNIEIESLKSNSTNFQTGLDWFMDRYNKARALKNTAQAQKLASDLGLYYSDARVKLANAYNMHIRQAYNNWLKNNPQGKYDDFVKEWNETHKRVWDEAFRQLQSWTDRMYTDALYQSSNNPGQVAVGIDTSVSTPPYRSQNIYLPGYKKGGSMTLEERMDLENAENLQNLNKMSIKNNARRNLQKERHEQRQSSQASKNISLLINRALGV